MTPLGQHENRPSPAAGFRDAYPSLEEELSSGVSLYWDTAVQVLNGSGIQLIPPDAGCFSLEKNFFSALFLYSYFRAGIQKPRRILYAAMNQCLRGMVTGCDNILDDEYKKTLDTDLPDQAVRFRSILDIMVSDRVLFHLLHKMGSDMTLNPRVILDASDQSLRALTQSGAQEATEEGGVRKRLTPEAVLREVHHYKTGLLFQSPWAVPDIIEAALSQDASPVDASQVKDALYRIGMGCQILDDMVDLSLDLRMERHNYVASRIAFGDNQAEQDRLKHLPVNESDLYCPNLILDFPDARRSAAEMALDYLRNGAEGLFSSEHQFMVDYTMSFIARQIGAERFLE